MIQPVIKWSGSKRSQANDILKFFPKSIDTYYEPFVGGASVLRVLLDNIQNYDVKRFVCTDTDKHLIDLWNAIKERPEEVANHYEECWKNLNSTDDKAKKREYFNEVRERLNNEHNPLDFMFIMRTTTNGMPRYNRDGEFNNSFHITRNGIIPSKLREIIFEWSELLNKHNVQFECRSYTTLNPTENDFCYLDPPYYNTKGMYQGGFDSDELFEWIRGLKCHYVWSYDGISGIEDNTVDVPSDIYTEHRYIESGNSSFKRTIGKDANAIVYESVYIK